MRLVIQRVTRAGLWADGVARGTIEAGLVAFTGVAKGDRKQDADYLALKLTGLRIFEDEQGKMNLNAAEAGAALMLVPNFTLYASTQKGKRPSFERAETPELARPLYDYFVTKVQESGLPVVTGVFQAGMRVLVDNDGPITIICDSPVAGISD